jgi:hypothetical protein
MAHNRSVYTPLLPAEIFRHILPVLAALPVETMFRKAFIRTAETSLRAGTLCAILRKHFTNIFLRDSIKSMLPKNAKLVCLLFLLLLLGCRTDKKPLQPIEGIIIENENLEDISFDLIDQYDINDVLPVGQDNSHDNSAIENILTETPLEENDYWDDLCDFITLLYERYTYYEHDGSNDEEWWSANGLIMNLLLTYLNSTESLKRDIDKTLPFLKCNISEDGLLRIYSWEIGGGGTFLPYNSCYARTPLSPMLYCFSHGNDAYL